MHASSYSHYPSSALAGVTVDLGRFWQIVSCQREKDNFVSASGPLSNQRPFFLGKRRRLLLKHTRFPRQAHPPDSAHFLVAVRGARECLKGNRLHSIEAPRLTPRGNLLLRGLQLFPRHEPRLIAPLGKEGDGDMLGLIAAVLIVLWLLGFLAFHLSAGLIHLLLIVGIVLLVLHFLRGSSRIA
jgi:uncharacterized protein DUF5670